MIHHFTIIRSGRFLVAAVYFFTAMIPAGVSVRATATSSTSTDPSQSSGDLLFNVTAYPWQEPGPGDERSPCAFLNTLTNHGLLNRNGTFIDLFEIATKMEEFFSFSPEFIYLTRILPAIDCGATYVDDETTSSVIRLDLQGLFQPGCEDFRSILVPSPLDDDTTVVNQTLVEDLLMMDGIMYNMGTETEMDTDKGTKSKGTKGMGNSMGNAMGNEADGLTNTIEDVAVLTLEDIAAFQYNRIFNVYYDTTYNDDPTPFKIAGTDFMAIETLSLGLISERIPTT